MKRNATLDGIRGVLAIVVMASHIPGGAVLTPVAHLAVLVFFVLSGMVLRCDNYPVFLARRLARLLPVYVVCTTGAIAMSGLPEWDRLFWFNLSNPPTWSLILELGAMLIFPYFVWTRGKRYWALPFIGMVFIPYPPVALAGIAGMCFMLGVWLNDKRPTVKALETAVPQYLGRISYPLYLCHWPILVWTDWPLLVKLAVAFAVAHVLTATVEAWSIRASKGYIWRHPRTFRT